MKSFRLIAADLDGTILDDDYKVRPELMSAITKAREQGVEMVVATGRLYPSALPFVKALGVTLPVIASNGAIIKDPVTGELISQHLLEKEAALEALRLSRNYGVQRFINIGDLFYTDAPESDVRMYSEALRVDFMHTDSLEKVVTGDPLMVVMRGNADEIQSLSQRLRERLKERVYLANSKPFFIDINNPAVSKGAGLVELCKRLKVDPDQVIAIGDGWNDREMFHFAGIGAAVANAPDELKKHANYVCSGDSYLGVIEVIERYILEEKS